MGVLPERRYFALCAAAVSGLTGLLPIFPAINQAGRAQDVPDRHVLTTLLGNAALMPDLLLLYSLGFSKPVLTLPV